MLENTVVQFLILIVSLVGLAASSHYAIRAVEKLIEITGLSEASAGFIILAVLTSTPELIVAVFSVLQGNAAVSIGDILGSNVFNIGAVLGLMGVLGYIKVCCTDLLVELTDMLSIIVVIPLLLVVSQYGIFEIPSQIIGVVLLIAFTVNTYLIAKKRTPPVYADDAKPFSRRKKGAVVATLLLSFIVVVISAQLTVNSAVNIAEVLRVPTILVGAKIVAIGTSLPELTLDLAAIRRGRMQLAIGGIIGSNLTNLTLILGLVLLASPFRADLTVFIEIIPFLMITTVIFWRFIMRGGVSKIGGALMLLTYLLFQILII